MIKKMKLSNKALLASGMLTYTILLYIGVLIHRQ